MLKKYAAYVASDSEAWKNIFDLLRHFECTDPSYKQGTKDIIQFLDKWNNLIISDITLDDETLSFIARMR